MQAFERADQIPSGAWQYEVDYPYDPYTYTTGVAEPGHDFTVANGCANGLPCGWGGYVDGRTGWVHTASHEILEMLANPYFTQFHRSSGPRLLPADGNYQQEICDPCQVPDPADSIDGTVVSDFVLPSYFDVQNDTGSAGAFSFFKHVTRPLTPAAGGQQEYQTDCGEWHMIESDDNNNLTDTVGPNQ